MAHLKKHNINQLKPPIQTMNKFRPILFSTPMVQAILEGRKTQTRRTLKPHPSNNEFLIELSKDWGWAQRRLISTKPDKYEILQNWKCPYGNIGDVLWVRETYCKLYESLDLYYFKDDKSFDHKKAKWKPSIHMPKAACRLFLRIKDVRVERLRDISEADAKAEGISFIRFTVFNQDRFLYTDYLDLESSWRDPRISFQTLWDSINAEKMPWKNNPWVWVIEFERIEKPIDFK